MIFMTKDFIRALELYDLWQNDSEDDVLGRIVKQSDVLEFCHNHGVIYDDVCYNYDVNNDINNDECEHFYRYNNMCCCDINDYTCKCDANKSKCDWIFNTKNVSINLYKDIMEYCSNVDICDDCKFVIYKPYECPCEMFTNEIDIPEEYIDMWRELLSDNDSKLKDKDGYEYYSTLFEMVGE